MTKELTPDQIAGLLDYAKHPRRFGLEQILVENSDYQTNKLRKRLLESGLKEQKCERCGNTEWLEEPIPLELNHKNGVNNDHRFENLELLCPNCHALTPTYRGRNWGKARNKHHYSK
jgi:ribosomal protein S27AE